MASKQWHREFKAKHGVSSGTYYAMRRKARDEGISTDTFDKLASTKEGYKDAKAITKMAEDDPVSAKTIGDLLSGESRLPGSKGSKMRGEAYAKLAKKWRKYGGSGTRLGKALGSPPRKAKSARLVLKF